MDLQDARRRLEELLRDLDDSSETLENEGAGTSTELSHLDQHPADTATELSDMQRESAVLEVVGAQRVEVLAALRRVDDGTYGQCVDCGVQIPDARLDIRPEAARCVDCQAKNEGVR